MNTPIGILKDRLGLAPPSSVDVERGSQVDGDGFSRAPVTYQGLEGDRIPALLFTPNDAKNGGGVVVFHQHSGEFHFGKSEVAGEVGDPFQAFGPSLARRGITVLAPDAVGFEDRRESVEGVEPDDNDWLQHYNIMAYRLVDGDSLMRKCLDDAQRAFSALLDVPGVDAGRAGVCGHSFGGLLALYHAAVDERCRFACISGAGASFGTRKLEGTGINMFELVPGLARFLDTRDLVKAILPRPAFLVSSSGDPYSAGVEETAKGIASRHLTTLHADGPHALDRGRHEAIVDWIVRTADTR